MNPVLEIIRLETNQQHGSFGMLRFLKELFCNTLEPYKYGNIPNESCIPTGQYLCKRVKSELVKKLTRGLLDDTFEITGVSGRTKILFHPGNVNDNTNGCILLAEKLGKLYGNRAILNSGQTFRRFMSKLEDYDNFSLTVYEMY